MAATGQRENHGNKRSVYLESESENNLGQRSSREEGDRGIWLGIWTGSRRKEGHRGRDYLDFANFICLELWGTIVMDEPNTSCKLKEKKRTN